MEEQLIISGDRSKEKAIQAYIKLAAALVAIGIVIFFWGVYMIASESYITSWKALLHADELKLMFTLFGASGGLLVILGIAVPFLAVLQAQKCYIDVYENHIEGTYLVQRKGEVDHYIPFQASYDQFDGAYAEKYKVKIRVGMEVYTTMAFNAEEICAEINARCQWVRGQ